MQQAARGRQAGPLQYGSYKVIETLSRRDLVSEFLARNLLLPDSPPVRLRVFSYNPYLPPDQLESHKASLRREAEALQKIGYHPNLITLRGFEAAPEDPNLLLEITDWSESGTLRALMNAGPLSLERKLELALGITAGLKAAHNAGVIHRDLRPENVLIGADGSPRLMNFEHARLEAPGAQTVGWMQTRARHPAGLHRSRAGSAQPTSHSGCRPVQPGDDPVRAAGGQDVCTTAPRKPWLHRIPAPARWNTSAMCRRI